MEHGSQFGGRSVPTASLPPLMVDKTTAAKLYGMSTTTYTKHERKGLVPRVNAAGRISVFALEEAARRLDGVRTAAKDDPDDALARWEAENAR